MQHHAKGIIWSFVTILTGDQYVHVLLCFVTFSIYQNQLHKIRKKTYLVMYSLTRKVTFVHKTMLQKVPDLIKKRIIMLFQVTKHLFHLFYCCIMHFSFDRIQCELTGKDLL